MRHKERLYSVYITFEIHHTDAIITSIRETFRETFQVIHNYFKLSTELSTLSVVFQSTPFGVQ